jgi:hypothetical protein
MTCGLHLQSLLDLSDAQVDDALYIRRLYLTKRGLLAVERNALMAEMDTVNKAIPHATESLASVSNVASLLQQNAIQDYQVYIKVCAAMRRGVNSTSCLLLKSMSTLHYSVHFSKPCPPRLLLIILCNSWHSVYSLAPCLLLGTVSLCQLTALHRLTQLCL